MLSTPPAPDEYAPNYNAYVSKVPPGDILETLATQSKVTAAELRAIDTEKSRHRYGAGKWSIREVLGHISDTERIMSYRMMRIGRGDQTPLPSFDENAYVPAAHADECDWGALIDDFESMRRATLSLAALLPADAWDRRGTASENPVSTRALAWIIAGHTEHHMAIIRERYLT